MLPEIVKEVLLFLGRRDLDTICVTSKWLEALIAQDCETYPFRRVYAAFLQTQLRRAYPDDMMSVFAVRILERVDEPVRRTFETIDDAMACLAPLFRRTYADRLEVDLRIHHLVSTTTIRLPPRQWTDLKDIFSSGAARHLRIQNVDLRDLNDDAFIDAVRCRLLEVRLCSLRGNHLSDDVLSSCAENGVSELEMWGNRCQDRYALSEDALLQFCFPPSGPNRVVKMDNLKVSDTFVARFFERLLATGCVSRPTGFVMLTSPKEQRGLEAYEQHLLKDRENPTYQFAPLPDGDKPYEFVLDYRYSRTRFCFGFAR